MKLSSDIVGNSNHDNNSLHKIPLSNTQVLRLRKAFSNEKAYANCKANCIKEDNQETIKPLAENILIPVTRSNGSISINRFSYFFKKIDQLWQH